jgi:hypothetical protein
MWLQNIPPQQEPKNLEQTLERPMAVDVKAYRTDGGRGVEGALRRPRATVKGARTVNWRSTQGG